MDAVWVVNQMGTTTEHGLPLMMVYSLSGLWPYNLSMCIRWINGVYIADTARVLGEVNIGENVSVWYGASIRGDVAAVTIGSGTNVQDNAVIHCDFDHPNVIGREVTIGHGAIVHGESVGDGTLIGMGATLLGRTRIGRGCLIAAGAVVTPGTVVPDSQMVVGVPGRVVRRVNDKEQAYLQWLAPHYVKLARHHHQHPEDERVRPFGHSGPPPPGQNMLV